ncbi:MAG: tRNA glutamyl-Q(34) synthetase GluQRS [Betaproteobacteria bacterium]|nr:tRNA glutamyl-Q(34) synthetase GluQRS [Betaproteobacteria bacterium]
MSRYVGRFAPSPTGPLHAGSLVAALASWLDARAHDGQWLIRIEDVDTPRTVHGADVIILQQLAACAMVSDAPVVYQSKRNDYYLHALQHLWQQQKIYACQCSRKDIEQAILQRGEQRQRHQENIYPGTCRHLNLAANSSIVNMGTPRNMAWRFQVNSGITHWIDRRLGKQLQNIAKDVGDFVLKRSDQFWAYQLAVVVDDALQGVTHVVRGEDLADNTPRQLALIEALEYQKPSYLHLPLVIDTNGEKLSKQTGAASFDHHHALSGLMEAARFLNLPIDCHQTKISEALAQWILAWREIFPTEA